MVPRRVVPLLVLLLICGILPLTTLATYVDNPPAQPGFTHSPKLSADDTGHGLMLAGGPIGYASPTIAEIDDNAGNGKEIAIGGTDGNLYVYHSNGSLAWSQRVTSQCNSTFPDGGITSTPAVGKLFGDGVSYVVVGYGALFKQCFGGVVAYNGRTGQERWRYQLQSGSESLHAVYSSPALADVDGDGKLEVGFGNFERDVMMLNSDGSKRWRFHNADTVWSSPAFADANGDGLPDLIIGSDISKNTQVGTEDGGYVTAFRGTDSSIIWRKFFDQVIYSSPAIADLNGDGVQEVIVGSGCYFSTATKGHWVKMLDIRDGSTIGTLNAAGCVASSPAIADLDGNGKLDIVAMVDGSGNNPQTPGYVQAWQYDNPTPKWSTAPGQAIGGTNLNNLGDRRSAVVADIDGNGSPEVLVSNWNDVIVLNGVDGKQLTCNNCGQATTKTLFAWYPLQSTPAVGDLDNNGKLEVVIGGTNLNKDDRGFLYVWTNITGLGSSSGSATPYSAPWPMFRRNATHTAIVPALLRSPASILVLTKQGGGAQTLSASLRDSAGETIAWNASADKSWLGVSPGNGTAPGSLTITVDPAGKNAGFDETGTISISSASGSPTISVRMLVVDSLYQTYLPSLLR